jgi:hypothetical protein
VLQYGSELPNKRARIREKLEVSEEKMLDLINLSGNLA